MDEIIKENVQVSDMDLLTSKGLYDNNDYTEKFYKLYVIYHTLLDKYLVRKFSLDKYDKSFDTSGLNFIPVKEENMDYYQYISQMNLNYIYLRNDIYVEKLSEEDMNTFLSVTEDFLNNPSEKLFGLIEKTYRDVINISNDPEAESMSKYGPDNDEYWFPSNELVFGFRHDDFADNGYGDGADWEENNNRQLVFINMFLDDIHKSSAEIEKGPVNFVWYNDFTIKEPALKR